MVLLELDRNLFPTAMAASHLPTQEGKEVKEQVSKMPGSMGPQWISPSTPQVYVWSRFCRTLIIVLSLSSNLKPTSNEWEQCCSFDAHKKMKLQTVDIVAFSW